jgi:hypothetical protein
MDEKMHGSSRLAVVQNYVRQYLYPAGDFPRHIFLDLDQILISHFANVVLPPHKHTACTDQKREDIERLAAEYLDIKVLLKDYPQVLVKIYSPLIQRFLRQKTPDPDRRKDIYQEVVVRLLEKKLWRIFASWVLAKILHPSGA